MTFPEVMALKLYTDFEKLQFELKRSIRKSRLFLRSNQSEMNNNDDSKANIQQERQEEFYHWLRAISLVLRKFGDKIGRAILYHGVNARFVNIYISIQVIIVNRQDDYPLKKQIWNVFWSIIHNNKSESCRSIWYIYYYVHLS